MNPLDRRGGLKVLHDDDVPQDLNALHAIVDKKVNEIKKDIMRLTFVVGEHPDAGLQKEITDIKDNMTVLKTAIHTLEKWGKDTINEYWHVKRPVECLGVMAVKGLQEQMTKQEQMSVDVMKIAADIQASKRSQVVTIIVAIIGFLAVYFKGGVL